MAYDLLALPELQHPVQPLLAQLMKCNPLHVILHFLYLSTTALADTDVSKDLHCKIECHAWQGTGTLLSLGSQPAHMDPDSYLKTERWSPLRTRAPPTLQVHAQKAKARCMNTGDK